MKSPATRIRALALAVLLACGLVLTACTTPDPEPSDPPTITPTIPEEPDFEALSAEAESVYQGYMDAWGQMLENRSTDTTAILEFVDEDLAQSAADSVDSLVAMDQSASGSITVTGFSVDEAGTTTTHIAGVACIDRSSLTLLNADGSVFVGESDPVQAWAIELDPSLEADGFIVVEMERVELPTDGSCAAS